MEIKKKTSRLMVFGVASLLLGSGLALSACSTQEKPSQQVRYTDEGGSKAKAHLSAKDQTDKLNAEEGISAEQIVVKITKEGYVTSHGDHFHYYNGKIPYDALISEELVLKDKSYQLNKADVVSKHVDGFIIRLKDKFYLYLKDPSKATHVRSLEEIKKQQEEHSHGKKHGKKASKAMNSKVEKAVQQAKASGRYTTDDGYIFTPASIVQDAGDAFICAHGDHFHYVPKSALSAGELAAAYAYLGKTPAKSSQNTNSQSPSKTTHVVKTKDGKQLTVGKKTSVAKPSAKPSESLDNPLSRWEKMPVKERHREADGLVFNPYKVTKRTAMGYVIPHGDHFHVIPFDQLNQIEIEAAEAVLSAGQSGQAGANPSADEHHHDDHHGKDETHQHDGHHHGIDNKHEHDGDHQGEDEKYEHDGDGGKHHQSGEDHKKDGEHASSEKKDPTNAYSYFFGKKIKRYGKGLDGKAYSTSDHYVFSPESIIEVDDSGFSARHEDHVHYISFGELEEWELAQVENWVRANGKKKAEKEDKPLDPDHHSGKKEEPKKETDSDKKDSDKKETETNKNDSDKKESEKDSPKEDSDKKKDETGADSKKDQEKKPDESQDDEEDDLDTTTHFWWKNFTRKAVQDGKEGYYIKDGTMERFMAKEDMDTAQIAFAEFRMSQLNKNYVFQIAPKKDGELEPALLKDPANLYGHAGSAVMDTGTRFIVPHVDHLHYIPYDWLDPETIATVKWVMTHPEDRPAPWVQPHGAEDHGKPTKEEKKDEVEDKGKDATSEETKKENESTDSADKVKDEVTGKNSETTKPAEDAGKTEESPKPAEKVVSDEALRTFVAGHYGVKLSQVTIKGEKIFISYDDGDVIEWDRSIALSYL